MASFESTKSEIVSSGLGQAIGLTASSIWSQIVEKIKAVVNRGAINQTLNAGGSYTIPQGYHNGSGKVTANSLASQTDANAGAAQILSGFTAWIKGNKVTGSMPNRGALNWSGSNTTYGVPAGYYSGGTIDSRPSYNNGYNAGVTAGKKGISSIKWTTLLTDKIEHGQGRESVSATIPSNVGANVIVLATSSVYDPNTPTPVSMTINGGSAQLFRPSNNGGAVIGIAPPGATIVFKGTYNRGPQYIIIAYGVPQ